MFSLSTPEDKVTTIYQPEGTGEKWKASDLSLSLSYARALSDVVISKSNVLEIGDVLFKNGNKETLECGKVSTRLPKEIYSDCRVTSER